MPSKSGNKINAGNKVKWYLQSYLKFGFLFDKYIYIYIYIYIYMKIKTV